MAKVCCTTLNTEKSEEELLDDRLDAVMDFSVYVIELQWPMRGFSFSIFDPTGPHGPVDGIIKI